MNDEPELRKQLDALRKDMQHVKEWLAAITLLLVILLLLLVSFRSPMIGLFTKCSRGWLWELVLSFVFACSPKMFA